MNVAGISQNLSARERKIAILPPCQVCGGTASGLHYGQNTCEACKEFFRRGLGRTKVYKCLWSTCCKIESNQKRICCYCRFQKCLSIGMSKTGIKMGRYTYEMRTKNILDTIDMRTKALEDSASELHLFPPLSIKSLVFNEVIGRIMAAYDGIVATTVMSDEDIKARHSRIYEEKKLRLEIFGPRATLPKDQYEEIFQMTGIDIDDRQKVMRLVLKQIEYGLRDLVRFVKNIPQFSSLSSQDQANLVKSVTSDYLLLQSCRGISSEVEVLLYSDGRFYHWDELYRIWDHDMIKTWLDICLSLQKLNLHREEVVILITICVLFTDRCQLEDPQKVEEIQWTLIQCLMYLLEKNHRKDKMLFARVTDRITAMRDVSEISWKIMPKAVLWPGADTCPLFSEIFSA